MQYRYLDLITALYITFLLISDVTAARLISVLGHPVSVTVIYFPFTYVLSDVLTEVYGYAQARRVVWHALFASILAGVFYQVVIRIPVVGEPEAESAYQMVLGAVPRTLVGGWLAVWIGGISNDYVLAKLKVITRGQYLWLRTITSTIVGETLNTMVFYLIALSGILSSSVLIEAIIAASLIKIAIEIIMTPWTYFIVNYLKRSEGIDCYDRYTDFNPFLISNRQKYRKAPQTFS